MRTLLFIVWFGWAATGQAATLKDADCLECHGDKSLTTTNAGRVVSLYVDPAPLAHSVHHDINCASCHADLTAAHPDDDVPARLVDCARCHAQAALTYSSGAHGLALKKGEKQAPTCIDCHDTHQTLPPQSPASPLYFARLAETCGRCHAQEASDVERSVHGKAAARGERDAPTCTDCHAEHKLESLRDGSALKISEDICSKCHDSEQLNTKYGLPADRVKTFFDSYHGLAASKGSTTAANCGSCHGYHKILPSADPESSINSTHLVETCGRCHPGAGEKFARAKVHVDLSYASAGGDVGAIVNHWVRRVYLVLIFGVVGLMVIHNGLLFIRKSAARARLHPRAFLRMDGAQRAQHAVLAVSFVVLAWSGFALKYPDSWASHFLMSNESVRGWTHRIAGVVLLGVGLWHLIYAMATRGGRQLWRDIAPRGSDLIQAITMAKYLVGLAPKRPATGRFGYAEKLEYWAVVWGTVIMGLTGLAIWSKIFVTHWMPRWVIDAATNIHYYEAVLACLAILVWHLYHVIFDPDVYPLNRAFLDGRVSLEWEEEEHPLELAITPATKPAAPPLSPGQKITSPAK